MNLVEITEQDRNIVLELAYATEHNITGAPLYKSAKAFLHPEAASLLEEAIRLAAQLGLRIKIFDAFRPLEVQQALWDSNPDPNFISNPEAGSIPHCRGVAVDLTLIDDQGSELDMGTGFDAFTSLSHHGNAEISVQAQRNRYLLMGIMTTAGWDFYRNEWWHYQLFNPRNYEALRESNVKTGML